MRRSFYELLHPCQINYAEIHYKFKLPWSPLFRKAPEIFFDLPHLLVPGQKAPLVLVIKDAHLFPGTASQIKIALSLSGRKTQTIHLDITYEANKPFHFYTLTQLSFPEPGVWHIQASLLWKTEKKSKLIWNHNLPGLPSTGLEIDVLAAPLPYPAPWKAGESHCHSTFSSDMVEFGAPLELMKEMGLALGLDWIACTDHSYDFAYHPTLYTCSGDPQKRWQEYQDQIQNINNSNTDGPLILAGEEVSCGNRQGKNVHLLVIGHPRYKPGQGDGGRRWLNNKPDLTIPVVLSQSPQAFHIAAHPREKISWLESFIFNRGVYTEQDLAITSYTPHPLDKLYKTAVAPTLRALQFWNGSQDTGFYRGRAFWVQQLLKGKTLLPWAANDAHGDFNWSRSVHLPLFSLRQNKNHLFGKCRTLIPYSGPPNLQGLLKKLENCPVICTDGPFLSVELQGNLLQVDARSNSDFGPWKSIRLFAGVPDNTKKPDPINYKEDMIFDFYKNNTEPQNIANTSKELQNSHLYVHTYTYSCQSEHLYYRLEGRTVKNNLVLTSALFPKGTNRAC